MDTCISRIRTFFRVKGFVEVFPHTSSILETKEPITFEHNDKTMPMMQTAKLYLETEMLNHPQSYFCVSSTYRDERFFPRIEFIIKGDIVLLQRKLLDFLGFEHALFNDLPPSFWNVKKEGVCLVHGIETMYWTDLLCNPNEMKQNLKDYSMLYTIFGKERVDNEVDTFLNHTFVERSSGYIDITNMIRAMTLSNLI